MVVEPYAVRIASPTAIPIIRATVTVADAIPNARRPTASTAAVERGVTVSPKPAPNTARVVDTSPIGVASVHRVIATSAAALATRPTIVTSRRDRKRTA